MATFSGKQPGYADPRAVVDETGPQVISDVTFAGQQPGAPTPTARGPLRRLEER